MSSEIKNSGIRKVLKTLFHWSLDRWSRREYINKYVLLINMKANEFKWEVSIMELENGRKKYKVTRRIPVLHISETKIFETKEEAKKQFEEWTE